MENTARNVGCEWLRSKQEEHGIIADLTGFDNLKAMLGAEENTRRRKGTLKTKKRKNYGYFQFQAQEDMPVNVAKVKGREATVVEGEKALTVDCTVNSAGLAISCSGTAEMVQVECSATKETEQKRIEKENVDTMVEMTQASATTNGVNSSIAIGVSLSSLEGNISFCRGVAETVPVETLTVNAMKQKRKVDRASKEMQEDTAKGMEREQVEFTDNIVLRQLLRRPRYFDGPSYNSWEMCSNCGQEGHTVCQCTMRKWKKKKLCFLCGSLDHVKRRCRKNRYCSVCKGRGHRARYCPERDQERSSHGICLQCGNSGHDMFSCTADYLPSDLKEIQCYVCRSFGHLCCADFPDIDPRESCGATGSAKAYTTCYKCGEEDHFAGNCSKQGWTGKRTSTQLASFSRT